MSNPRVSADLRAQLAALWRTLHITQSQFVAAQLRVDQLSFPFTAHNDSLVAAAEHAKNNRATVREQLRAAYSTHFGPKAASRVETYFAALDNLYGPSHRYSFVAKIGTERATLETARRRAAATVNRITGKPDVLTLSTQT